MARSWDWSSGANAGSTSRSEDGILNGVADDRDSMRASDKDREQVAERLREALSEGRLNFDEYDERLKQVYTAKTYGDLRAPLADLPSVAPPQKSHVVYAPQEVVTNGTPQGPPPRGTTSQWIAAQWSGWVTISIIVTVIWLLSGRGDFWPVWPIAVLGAINVARTINGLGGGAPRREWDRQQRKAAERAVRRERRDAERGIFDDHDARDHHHNDA